ncbi:uncharacterized protein LOC100213952 [Hydra vulgaris]|uniref:uncharacterized protein LOC100213952 n=1 Tax=Hydra vulgaris TaxID=6087 RepID=UPI001F5E9688|nr:uncharacterized protein LOC100213952 [Hydra vulgaris]XP_047129263.1 uncharacterized protein LOC100213952 [Hydra vulgaris]
MDPKLKHTKTGTLVNSNQINKMKDDFFKTLKSLFKKTDFSDKVLCIIEEQLDKTKEDSNVHLKDPIVNNGSFLPKQISIPIHSLVFCINSRFFRNLFYDSNMLETKENKVVLHVTPGDIQYVELVINSFYDPDIINNINTIKLLKVLEYADRYLCDSLLKHGLSIVKNIVVTNFDECNFLLDKIAYFENYLGHLLTKDFFFNVKKCCSQFLTEAFTPLECCVYNKSLNDLNFLSFLTLLKSDGEFLFSENSVVTCVLNWLEANETHQTEENIKALLSECRYEYIDVSFLRNGLCYTNSIFSKWSGYLNWYINAVSYPSMQNNAAATSKRTNRQKKITSSSTEFRNMVNHKKATKNNELCHKYELKMKYIVDTKRWISDKNMLYRGYVLQLFVYATNKVVLELIIGKDNQKKEMENFILKIPFEIQISNFHVSLQVNAGNQSFYGNCYNYQETQTHFYNNSQHNAERNSNFYTKKDVFQFSNSNFADISLGEILNYQPRAIQHQNDMIVAIYFTA